MDTDADVTPAGAEELAEGQESDEDPDGGATEVTRQLHFDLHGHDLLDDVPTFLKRRNHSLPEQQSKRTRTENIAMAMAAMPEELEYYHFEMNVEGRSYEKCTRSACLRSPVQESRTSRSIPSTIGRKAERRNEESNVARMQQLVREQGLRASSQK
jgi:hypothetical protein